MIVSSLVLLAGACDAPGTATTPSATPLTRHIAVLGDSLAVSPSRAESFPAVLQQHIDRERLPWRVVNAGLNGDTTAGGLRRFDQVLAEQPAILILALGANDGLRGVPVATIEQNLSAIVERARARDMRVLLCGMETLPIHGVRYMLDFRAAFPRVAARYELPLVPFLLTGVALHPDFNAEDLVHPNAAGARRIADTVWVYLHPMLEQGIGD